MWWSSFWAVLDDLRCFAFGIVQQANCSGQLDTRQIRHKNPKDPVVDADAKIILEPNVRYTKEHSVTQLIRATLKQTTAIQPATGDLTQLEWLAYLYNKSGRSLPWLVLALVPIGVWNQTLKEQSDITISSVPKTHALMEWQASEKDGHIGVVVKVTPDHTITIWQLGIVSSGIITEMTWSAGEWRPLHPVFISVM